MGNWISVEDRLPEVIETVFIAYITSYGSCYSVGYINSNKEWRPETEMIDAWNYDGGATIYLDEPVTHWMPIPEPPNEK